MLGPPSHVDDELDLLPAEGREAPSLDDERGTGDTLGAGSDARVEA